MQSFEPSAQLKPFVKTFTILESENGMESRILPVTSIVLAFRIKGAVSQKSANKIDLLPSAMIAALRNQARLLNYERQTAMLLVAFKEGGANAFFREPLYEAFGTSLPLEDILRRSKIIEAEESLCAARTNRDRIETIENFLLSQLREGFADKLVLAAVEKIKIAHGDVRIKELVKFFGTSRDPFEKRFRLVTGTSPKQFAQIVRLRSLINGHSPGNNLAELAARFGYFDQAHFIKDFKSFTGVTPREFFSSATYW